VPSDLPLRVGTLNLASGRGRGGSPLDRAPLAAALAGVDVDVLAVQEVDVAQPRSAGADQAGVVAGALGAPHWRMAATLAGTPGPVRTWRSADPPTLRGPGAAGDGAAGDGPGYGIALVSRRPVHRWRVLGLGAGRARLPVRAVDPRTGRPRLWLIPDEPRAAIAAELDGLTVVATHLSFAPVTAARQLARLRRWVEQLPGPVVVAGDLNLPGGLPARLLHASPLVRGATYPAAAPRVQLDHLLLSGRHPRGDGGSLRALDVGDHLLATAPVPAG
jgi:endonuclease/exonuclease/phosphatase family metal-dependent hydrolase